MSQAEPPDETPAASNPSVDDLLKDVGEAATEEPRGSQDQFEQRVLIRSLDGAAKLAHLVGLKSHYQHKSYWSTCLLMLVIGLMVFQSVLIVFVGLNRMDFNNYQWLLPALLVQNLAQVVGLAVFVVRALFKDTLFGESK
jgi:hypothetical protein